MPTSATGTSTERHPRAGGFTLLELLVVLLIIGVTLTMATLAIGPLLGRRDGGDEAQRLGALVQLAREQAVLQGVEHGLALSRDGYRVLALGEDGWQPVEGSAYRARTLPPPFRLRLTVEGRGVELAAEPPDEPQLLLLSSGETTPFALELAGAERVCTLVGDGLADLPPPACRPA